MSSNKNITQINEEFEECRTIFEQLQKVDILENNIQGMLQTIFNTDFEYTTEVKLQFINTNKTYLVSLLENYTSQSVQERDNLQKQKKLLNTSFDLSQTENRKAMKEFGITNISGIFTKLYSHGILNFQDLLWKYQSLDDIIVE